MRREFARQQFGQRLVHRQRLGIPSDGEAAVAENQAAGTAARRQQGIPPGQFVQQGGDFRGILPIEPAAAGTGRQGRRTQPVPFQQAGQPPQQPVYRSTVIHSVFGEGYI